MTSSLPLVKPPHQLQLASVKAVCNTSVAANTVMATILGSVYTLTESRQGIKYITHPSQPDTRYDFRLEACNVYNGAYC